MGEDHIIRQCNYVKRAFVTYFEAKKERIFAAYKAAAKAKPAAPAPLPVPAFAPPPLPPMKKEKFAKTESGDAVAGIEPVASAPPAKKTKAIDGAAVAAGSTLGGTLAPPAPISAAVSPPARLSVPGNTPEPGQIFEESAAAAATPSADVTPLVIPRKKTAAG